MKFSLAALLPLAMALSASAQATSAFTDAKTGITFEAFTDATTGYTFGIALPTTPGTDFVGILIGKAKGWAGISLGGGMTNKLLIAAWPSGTKIVSSFRGTTAFRSPPEATGAYTMTPIDAGTYVNATNWSYTFLCKGCVLADGTTFAASDASGTLGWAFSAVAPAAPANHATTFQKHSAQGHYTMDLSAAKSAKYATYAALAGTTVPTMFKA
ncbi:hypothetical protein EG329_003992 [Mollisiaceae sp. DMI_Dod_QoI]|nr:hypothetical protein EG329_003992 [Helotiales sp. DMI_Dod_QoI]